MVYHQIDCMQWRDTCIVNGQAGHRRGTEPPLAERVAARLRDLIVQDELKPGERIRERELAERLAVSRTPLREALKGLAAEGLVELSPNRSATVANPEPQEIRDLLEVMGGIEGLAGELAAARARDEEIAEIRALHHEMLAAWARKDRLAYFKVNQAIHGAIVSAAANPALEDVHRRVNARLYRVRYRSNLRNTRWHTAIEEHESILEALEARDAKRLAGIMRAHLGSTWAKVSEIDGPAPDSTTAAVPARTAMREPESDKDGR